MTRFITYKSKTVIFTGFTVVMLLLLTLAALSVHDFRVNDQKLEQVGDELLDVKYVFEMRAVAYERALILDRMLEIDDPFVRNEEYNHFRVLAEDFIKARDKLLNKNMSESGTIWQQLKQDINRNAELQNKVAELILDDNIPMAREVLVNDLIPAQDKAMGQLTRMFDTERSSAEADLLDVRKKNRISLAALSILTAVAILIGLLVSFVVARRINRTENTLVTQSGRIWSLYELSANPKLNTTEQITATLELGCKMFGMEIGKVCAIDLEAQTNTFLHVVAAEDMDIKAGTVLPLKKTFCNIVIDEDKPIAIHHVAQSPYRQHACYEFSHLESYIAVPIHVNGVRYGTVNFSSRTPRYFPFTEVDKDLMNLISGWISVAMERELIKDDMRCAKEAAESASQAKSSFLANMSHEIRTPLTAILGYSESLLDSFQTEEERVHAVQAIIRGGSHLQQIINDILDLSKIEAQQLEIEQLDVPLFQLLADVELVSGNRARDKGLEFNINYHFPVPAQIWTDPTRLKQILINLCGNAVKFTEAGSVMIDVSYLPDSQQLQFVVSDTGIGMSQEEMGRLFIAFSQADASTTRKYGGSGLGLCISRQLANKLGGDITCESDKGVGSRFTLTIAAGAGVETALVNQVEDVEVESKGEKTKLYKPSSFHGHILLAEDSPDNQRLISMHIRRTGAEVSVAENGKVAVELACNNDFDLILMDMQMPIMNGLEATQCLREQGCTTPIVALTANAMKSDRDKYIEAGAVDYLTKPLDLDHFYDVITGYLKPKNTPAAESPAPASPVSSENSKRATGLFSDFAEDEEFQELLQEFVNMLPEIMGEMMLAAESEDWETLQAVSHRLKGSGGSYGFPEITELAKKINDDVKTDSFDHIDHSMHELNDLIQSIVERHSERKAS
jgi:signal transduction histidine kinase/CheY-like chemotaxis protein